MPRGHVGVLPKKGGTLNKWQNSCTSAICTKRTLTANYFTDCRLQVTLFPNHLFLSETCVLYLSFSQLHSFLYPSSQPHNLFISPSLLPSPYYGTHHLLLILIPHANKTPRMLRHVPSYKSYSHITAFTLVLLLTSGDMPPHPEPLFFNCTQRTHQHQPTSSGSSRNLRNLVSIPLLSSSLPFSCAPWNARSVCNILTAVHDLFVSNSFNLLAVTETWLHVFDTPSTLLLLVPSPTMAFSHFPRPSRRKGGGVGILLSHRAPSRFSTLLPLYPSLSLIWSSL